MSLKYDDLKREDDIQIQFDTLFSIETIETKIIYIFTQFYNHPLQSKTQFKVGLIHVYFEGNNKQMQSLRGEITSAGCLNQEVEWDQRYFDKIRVVLDQGGKDFKYSIKTSDEENATEVDQILKITERIYLNQKKQTNSEVAVLKVKLKLHPQSSNLEALFQLFREINGRKKNKIESIEKCLNQTEKQRQELLKELENSNQINKQNENILRNKFLILLNEKKRKIKELFIQIQEPQQNQLINAIQIKDENIIINRNNPSKMIDEGVLLGSQFPMSQPVDFSSLFEPSQVDKYQSKKLQQKDENEKKYPQTKQELIMIKKEQNYDEIEHLCIEDIVEGPRKQIK